MRGEKMKNLICLAISLFSAAAFAQGTSAVTPTTVKITVYSMSASLETDCSNALVVKNYGTAGKEFDFAKVPSLGGANVPSGTYKCVILQMSDVIKFVPATTEGVCAAGTEYTIDVCRAGNGNYTTYTQSGVGTTLTYGSSTGCTGTSSVPANDRVLLFLSTASTNSAGGGGGEAFVRPVSGAFNNGFTLTSPWIVGDSGSGTFIVNFTNKIVGTGSDCDLNPPIFGFR